MAWSRQENSKHYKRGQWILIAVLVVVLIVVAVLVYSWSQTQQADPATEITQQTVEIEEEVPEAEQSFDAATLISALDTWQATHNDTAGVVISDSEGKVLASSNTDEIYFAASIYKLFVAYEGYLQVDRGEVDPDEVYIGENTRWECLDLMIRESDSPCAEKLMAEIGQVELNDTLASYGIENTNMLAITTTAGDAARMLARISSASELSIESRKAFLESMRTQIYTDTFDQVFTEENVYNKIGFRELDEYHDVAIIEFTDGRILIVSALTDGVGTVNLRALGSAIRDAVL